MNLQASLFAIEHPVDIIDRWFNPCKHSKPVIFRGRKLPVRWTRRAEEILSGRKTPLVVEMQLYFSCVVKKRVIFHEQSDLPSVTVNDKLHITFRPVQASACDPQEFAKNYPVQQEFTSSAANKMRPGSLEIDYRNNQWIGEFSM